MAVLERFYCIIIREAAKKVESTSSYTLIQEFQGYSKHSKGRLLQLYIKHHHFMSVYPMIKVYDSTLVTMATVVYLLISCKQNVALT